MLIKVLAEDIKNTSYLNYQDCAITRALKRAGLPYHDAGCYICRDDTNKSVVSLNEDSPLYNEAYAYLSHTVQSMYKYAGKIHEGYINPIEPRDFEVEIDLPQP